MCYQKTINKQIFRLIILILFFFLFQINFYANAQGETIPNWINVRHSPFNLVEPPDITNPVLTTNDVTDVSASLVADPFLFYEDEAWYMFFEIKNIVTNKGDIGLATSSDGFHWEYQKIVLSETKHLSYPLILKSNGEYYMIPETYKWNQVRIYRANDFPYNWTYLTSIASGRPFVDPTIFQYNNKWWLFVSRPSNDILYLYYSDDLISGWTEHPMSPVIVGDASLARPGGRSFVYDLDRIIRIAQKDDIYYGEQVRAFEVDILTEEDYAEHEISESPLLKKSGFGWNAGGMHHFDPWWTGKEWICAVDGAHYPNSGWSIGIYTSVVFIDVPPGHWAEEAIYKIYVAGITKCCSSNPLKYCPQVDVSRAQMAAFLVRAVDEEPPVNYCATGSTFLDIPTDYWACKYIKRLSQLGITQGCGGGNYCPNVTVTRDQMAAFLVRSVDEEPPANYCATGSPFTDVSPGYWACRYIKRLSELEITQGCGGGNYCPNNPVTRAQMAVFLARAFLEME